MRGKVVVNRCMSLDGFIAGPGHSMDWSGGRALADFVAPDDFAEVAAATGAVLVGRRTWEVGDRMEAEEPGSTDYPFSGPMFLLTHRPLEPPDPEVTILSGDIGEAFATALEAAGGKKLEILGVLVDPRATRGHTYPSRRDAGIPGPARAQWAIPARRRGPGQVARSRASPVLGPDDRRVRRARRRARRSPGKARWSRLLDALLLVVQHPIPPE
jgi:dihydrofolate reductase